MARDLAGVRKIKGLEMGDGPRENRIIPMLKFLNLVNCTVVM